jgi:hypothetical protein
MNTSRENMRRGCEAVTARDGCLKIESEEEAFAPRLIREVAELSDDSGDHHREAAERRPAEQHRH